jgi:hypothetical protein
MKEVSTEEEAFAEMRRFLEVNNIPSDVTVSVMVEERERWLKIVPRHKEIHMCQRGFTPKLVKRYPDPCFSIYYGSDRPEYERLGSLKEHGLKIKRDHLGNVVKDDEGYPMLVSDWYTMGNKWYIPLWIYLDDLAKREAGEE